MFERLFSASGLSMERLRVLVELAGSGSFVKAAAGDPVRQSQYSRQIRELEDYFQTKLIVRQGRGVRLTPGGRELARISRFFMMGISNFRRGCLAQDQHYSIGASATFTRQTLIPRLTNLRQARTTFATDVLADDEIERKLHDLSLDFGVVSRNSLSRPLQVRKLAEWRLCLALPESLALNVFRARSPSSRTPLPLALAVNELPPALCAAYRAQLVCGSFMEALSALQTGELAAILPTQLLPAKRITSLPLDAVCEFYLAWNPRLLRLNPQASRTSQGLLQSLAEEA